MQERDFNCLNDPPKMVHRSTLKSLEWLLKGDSTVLDSKGNTCEYDGYVVPEQGEDTPENKKLREAAMIEFKRMAAEMRAEIGVTEE